MLYIEHRQVLVLLVPGMTNQNRTVSPTNNHPASKRNLYEHEATFASDYPENLGFYITTAGVNKDCNQGLKVGK